MPEAIHNLLSRKISDNGIRQTFPSSEMSTNSWEADLVYSNFWDWERRPDLYRAIVLKAALGHLPEANTWHHSSDVFLNAIWDIIRNDSFTLTSYVVYRTPTACEDIMSPQCYSSVEFSLQKQRSEIIRTFCSFTWSKSVTIVWHINDLYFRTANNYTMGSSREHDFYKSGFQYSCFCVHMSHHHNSSQSAQTGPAVPPSSISGTYSRGVRPTVTFFKSRHVVQMQCKM